MSPQAFGGWPAAPAERIEARITIERDGTVVGRSGKVEYGQGIRTGFARVIAAALDVPIGRVRVELGDTDLVPWDMGTFGSLSTATDGRRLHAAATSARTELVARAAARWNCRPLDLATHGGRVIATDGRSLGYEELTADLPLTGDVRASDVPDRDTGPVDDRPLRIEAFDLVTGRARFAADVRLPGMLRGHVLHPPVPGSRIGSIDDRAARDAPGVVAVVREGNFVGVVAERDEQSAAAVQLLDVTWLPPEPVLVAPVHLPIRADAGVDDAIAAGTTVRRARFDVPHIAHASIGPSAAVVEAWGAGAVAYVATQRPFAVRDELAALLGLAPDQVHVRPQAMSGMYGRGNANDVAMEAARLSRAVSRPVLVQWTREEEFRLSPHRPFLEADLSAALDGTGAIVAWRGRMRTNRHTYGGDAVLPPEVLAMTSGRNATPPYAVDLMDVEVEIVPGLVRTGAFRSLAAAPNVFATESFVDELAQASGQDPIAFRLRMTLDPRLRAVLEAVQLRSRWDEWPHRPGAGLGVACAIYNGTYVAEVAQVRIAESGKVHLERVCCVVDAGHLVHPDGARQQIEGGVQQAASWALLEQLHIEHGRVSSTTWRDYPIATSRDAPEQIDVAFITDDRRPSTGTGEPGSVPTAAAIANAVFAACGRRVRRLPLSAAPSEDAP